MPQQTPDDGSVLGNLPRARPGRRSAKRASGASTQRTGTQRAAGSTKRSTAAAAKKSTGAAAKRSRARQTASSRGASSTRTVPPARNSSDTAPSRGGPDPVGDALRVAGKVAELGLKTAGGIVRRLPGL